MQFVNMTLIYIVEDIYGGLALIHKIDGVLINFMECDPDH